MTYIVFTGATTSANSIENLVNGDILEIAPGSFMATTGASPTINATGNVDIFISGAVYGNYIDVNVALTSGQAALVYIDKTADLSATYTGVAIAGGGYHQVVNAGTIQGFNAWGVFVSGAGAIVNQAGGVIEAVGGIADGDLTATDVNDFVNYGVIMGTTYSFIGTGATDQQVLNNQGVMVGVVDMGNNATNLLYNTGTIALTNVNNSTGIAANDSIIDNLGVIYQTVAGSTATVNMIQLGSANGDYVYNGGTLYLAQSGGGNAASHAIAVGNGSHDYVDNIAGGQIFGNIAFGTGAGDSLINAGLIVGNITLGNGVGDQYSGTQGKLFGTVVCGSGGDTVSAGSDVETIAAGLGNDTFNMANGGETVIHETLAAQHLNGFDIVSNFQTYQAATQQGTFLQLAPSMSATTSFIAYNGGTLVQMALGGGNYSYVDVLGVGVSTVQAQTYFA
jgi:hypothetical protein